VAARWPEIEFAAVNPFGSGRIPLSLLAELQPGGKPCGTVVLSGLLASANVGEVQQVLERTAGRLRAGGLLVLHDNFLPGGALPPPEVVLGSLGRRMRRGGCRTWSAERLETALSALGFQNIESTALPAGTLLVTARRA